MSIPQKPLLQFSLQARKLHSPAGAFTLIELLTVIAIIGILAAIIIPTVGKVRMTARKAQTTSNLRQIGIAIIQYANDRKDNRVPGPFPGDTRSVRFAIQPRYRYEDKNVALLSSSLAPYLSTRPVEDLGSGEYVNSMVFTCAGILAQFPEVTTKPHFVSNFSLTGFPSARVFGESSDKPAIRYSELDQFGGPARVWALTTLDHSLHTDNNGFNRGVLTGSSGWYTPEFIPAQPVFGSMRLRLYFDAHVASVPRHADP